jgi:putative spermidine/putrescine transport system substrate-binding protein
MSFRHGNKEESEMTADLSRRNLMGGAAALAADVAISPLAFAQAKALVAATFPGTWNEADRNVIAPAFRSATGAVVTQSIILGTDQVARLTAAKGSKPPFDVAFFDTPQVLDAIKEGLIVEYPAAQSPHFKMLVPKFQDKWGPKITMQVIGIGYNPKKISTAPKSWDELWDPKYKRSRWADGAQQSARHCLLCRTEPDQRRQRDRFRAGVQGASRASA